MHNAAFLALGLPHRYETRDVEPHRLGDVVDALRADDVLGANLTIPHKEAAPRLVDELAEEARRIGAVNTIVRRSSRLVGDNTDGYGFAKALAAAGVDLRGKDVMVLGASDGARRHPRERHADRSARRGSPCRHGLRRDAARRGGPCAHRRDDAARQEGQRREECRRRGRTLDAPAPGGTLVQLVDRPRGAAQGHARRSAARDMRLITAGESHGAGLVAILDGVPAGVAIAAADIDSDLRRRQLGYGRGARQRIERDAVTITGGVRHGRSTGAPIALQITNRDAVNWERVMSVEPVVDP